MDEEWIVAGKNRALVKPRGADRRVKFGVKRRERFLEHLAATCNVTASAEAAGISFSAAYRARMKDPEFRADWQLALEQGYARLEAALLERAARGADRARLAGDGAIEGPDSPEEIDWDKAIQLLTLHGKRLAGTAKPIGRTPGRAPIELVAVAFIKRMKALGVRPEALPEALPEARR